MKTKRRYLRYATPWYEQQVTDLHDLVIRDDLDAFRNRSAVRMRDNSSVSECGTVKVFFRDLEERLIEQIEKADLVIGCVAWLTSMPILEALVKTSTQIIVQKEDFLRPDIDASGTWKQELHDAYGRLQNGMERHEMPPPLGEMTLCGDPTVDPVRCVGNYNRDKRQTSPRAHHKFVVFCRLSAEEPGVPNSRSDIEPYAVWTGSFNFTRNGTRSFENAVLLTDRNIVDAYVNEYAQIAALSEPLDWETDWVCPQWRIGT